MKVCCIDCSRKSMPKNDTSEDRAMGRSGFVKCSVKKNEDGQWLAAMFPRECEKFQEADDAYQVRERLIRRWKP